MYTLEQIQQFMEDPEAQKNATAQEWKDMRDDLITLLQDKPVRLANVRHRFDEIKRQVKYGGRPTAAKSASQPTTPTVISKPSANDVHVKYVCRSCGETLSPSAKAVSEHYEKKHYSEYVRNRATISSHPYVFVKKA